ncbi:MAG TPA: HTTM domain-containing protein [Myxococcota bacterium]|nr:HTTM domain-containing protein [Myxococcota bacterium]
MTATPLRARAAARLWSGFARASGRAFEIDLRSLALLRVGLGAMLLVDLARRARFLERDYTDLGRLPAEALAPYGAFATRNLHTWASGEPAAVAALFALQALFALALLLGWHTRIATGLCWVMVTSLQWRNPGLNLGGDVMMRLMLFWGLFLPLGARASLDARRRSGPPPADAFASWATAAVLLQMGLTYWMALLHRGAGTLWWSGDALYFALHYDQFATRFAVWLRQFETILPALTYLTLAWETAGPVLAISPFGQPWLRGLAVAGFVALHLGIAACFRLDLFGPEFAAIWMGFLPGAFWDALARRIPTLRRAEGTPLRVPAAAQAAVAVLLVYVVAINESTLERVHPSLRLPEGWTRPAELLRIDQRWALFAPDPPRYDGWYVMAGRTADGREVDLLRGGAPKTWDKPPVVSALVDPRTRRYLASFELQSGDPRWPFYVAWLCREANARRAGPDRLLRVNVYYVRETTTLQGPVRGEILNLASGDCTEDGG